MKRALIFSIVLNLGLLGAVLILANQHRKPASEGVTSTATAPDSISYSNPEPARPEIKVQAQAFRWSQLDSGNDYKAYVAHLRAIGCPEATIGDIVRGDARRAFAFKRAQLGLDGSGPGPWSQSREAALVATLMENHSENTSGHSNLVSQANDRTDTGTLKNPSGIPLTASASTASSSANSQTENGPVQNGTPPGNVQPRLVPVVEPVYPVAFRQVDLANLGFGPSEQEAIKQVQEQFVQDIGGLNQNPNDPAYLARWQQAQINADDELRAALGSEQYIAFVQQQYYNWFKPQVQAAASSGSSVTINPALFSVQQ